MTFQPEFYDHEIVKKSIDDYKEMTLSPQSILSAWACSMFAHELLDASQSLKGETEMSEATLQKYINANEHIKRNEPIAKPVIGVGITDGIEIGIGREIVAACKNMQVNLIPVHVRRAQFKDVEKLLK